MIVGRKSVSGGRHVSEPARLRRLAFKNVVCGGSERIFTDHPVYGSRRLQVALLREGISVGRRRVRRLMRKLGLWAARPKRSVHPEHKVYPYLLRGKMIDQPNQSLPSRKRGVGR